MIKVTAEMVLEKIRKEEEEKRKKEVQNALTFLNGEAEWMLENNQTLRMLHRSTEGPVTGVATEPEVQKWLQESGFILLKQFSQQLGEIAFFLSVPI